MEEILSIIDKFIDEMNYLENEHVLGVYFYGSFLTGFNNKDSDIDLHIIFDNLDPLHLIRGNTHIDGKRIEYFEKPIGDVYLTVDNEFENQNNATLSIIGTSKIIFDKTGELKKLQEYTKEKFSHALPPIDTEAAREYISILNNRMEKLRNAAEEGSPYFLYLYYLTIEKIRKFYHRLNGLPKLPTSKIARVYTDAEYRESFYKSEIPDEKFLEIFFNIINDQSFDFKLKLQYAEELFAHSKRNVPLDEKKYRIHIESRNK